MALANMNNPDELLKSKDLMRKTALGAVKDLEEAATGAATSLEGERAKMNEGFGMARTAGTRAIRQGMGQGLASAAFGAGQAGRAGYGAALQAGQQGGVEQGNLYARIANEQASQNIGLTKGVNEAKIAGAQAGVEGIQAVAKMGTDAEMLTANIAADDKRVQEIIDNNKGFFNDDEGTMRQQIMDYAAQFATSDPARYQRLMQRAANIQNKVEDV